MIARSASRKRAGWAKVDVAPGRPRTCCCLPRSLSAGADPGYGAYAMAW